MDFSIYIIGIISMELLIVYFKGSKDVFLSMKFVLIFANSADPALYTDGFSQTY